MTRAFRSIVCMTSVGHPVGYREEMLKLVGGVRAESHVVETPANSARAPFLTKYVSCHFTCKPIYQEDGRSE